jgi:predicted nucleic acid-binding Zn ribbon protein
MDRAGKVMRALNLQGGVVSPADLARAAWPQAVGKRIAAHARVVGFREGCLLVEVEDPVWLQHLRTLAGQLLGCLRRIAGADVVARIEFRPGVPRREPQRSGRLRAAPDEADGIQDPILRRLYKASRARSA